MEIYDFFVEEVILKVRAGAFSLEAANPRHEHEWQVWENVKLPKDAVLIPGVISSPSPGANLPTRGKGPRRRRARPGEPRRRGRANRAVADA